MYSVVLAAMLTTGEVTPNWGWGGCRGCYGCYGPMETPNTAALAREWQALGASPRDIRRAFGTFNAAAEPFQKESQAHGD